MTNAESKLNERAAVQSLVVDELVKAATLRLQDELAKGAARVEARRVEAEQLEAQVRAHRGQPEVGVACDGRHAHARRSASARWRRPRRRRRKNASPRRQRQRQRRQRQRRSRTARSRPRRTRRLSPPARARASRACERGGFNHVYSEWSE